MVPKVLVHDSHIFNITAGRHESMAFNNKKTLGSNLHSKWLWPNENGNLKKDILSYFVALLCLCSKCVNSQWFIEYF